MENVTPLAEVLLTILALSQEDYRGILNRAVPSRLHKSVRVALENELFEADLGTGYYLTEEGCCYLDTAGLNSKPFYMGEGRAV